MTIAKQDDIVRLLPGIQDHSIVELLAMQATLDELEAALQLLQDNDAGLIEIKRQKGDRVNLVCGILEHSDVQLPDDLER